ncbi:c-type cytochrome [Pedobacter sp. HMF7647]|uniref:C-type cytochrome n=1 Tax=Hufsiella arboris TaxID=2695275 RepID=A0A7K1YC40_9SPHI|nr:cytochrome c [Hufsiella arboris]MXV52157.1 c-type cytochrome [Hufsiella arboris]
MKKIVSASVFLLLIFLYACQSDKEIEQQRYFVNGKSIFEQHCQNCHGANGEGLGELYPPLTDTVFMRSNKSKIACIIKNGSNTALMVHNKKYEGKMPAESDLSDIEIAEIVNYITNSFGNKLGDYDVNNAAADLKNCQ